MKRVLVTPFLVLAVACGKDDKITPAPEPARSSFPAPAPAHPSPTPSTAPANAVEGQDPPHASGAPPSPAAPAFDAIDRLASSGNQNDAFKVLDESGAARDKAKIAAQWSCYEALAFYTLNQITAGSTASDHCLSKVGASDATTWKGRLDTAKAGADKRVKDAITNEVAQDCGQRLAGDPHSGCPGCMTANDFSNGLKKDLAAKDLNALKALHPAVLNRARVLPP